MRIHPLLISRLRKAAQAAALALSLAAAAPLSLFPLPAHAAEASVVHVESLNGASQPIEVEVPADPKRVAVIDAAALDMLDHWGLAERIVAMPKATPVPFLTDRFKDDAVRDIGTLKEVDMEGLMASEPDVIFISGRLAKKYDELSRIAPVIYLSPDRTIGSFASFEKNLLNVARIFGKEAAAKADIASLSARIQAIREKAAGASALVGLVTASHVNLLGDQARCSLIGREFGFKNIAQKANANHGNEASFELLLKLNPDWLFVLDRDSAIARPGAKLAADILDNEMVGHMKAKQAGRIVYLTPAAWYLAEGGPQAMDLMVGDVEKALGIGASATK